MLKLRDLANRSDFDVGPLRVSPSRRHVTGPGGEISLEPLIMHVFLLLLDSDGRVVTRDELFDECWGGVIVGDDSLNRAIGKVRRIAADVAPGLFEIETIPRTGYRLIGPIVEMLGEGAPGDRPGDTTKLSRRTLVGGTVAAVTLAAAGGVWWANRRRTDPRFDALMERGEEALRMDDRASSKYFERAVAIKPDSSRAWGLLGYSLATGIYTGVTGPTAQAAERAARNALSIDPGNSDAQLAMTLIQSDTLDWFAREEQLRRISAADPQNARAMRSLGQFLHSVGRCRESLAVVERALALEPLTPDHWARKAGRLWVLGRIAEADKVIDRAMQFWPSHSLVRLMRLMIYAYSGRARAALAMIEDEEAKPTFVSAAALPVWRASLRAIETPDAATIETARNANLEGSQGSPQIAAWAILTLSALDQLDAAFEVANGFLLDRGSVIVRPRTDSRLVPNAGWRNTFGLFVPPTKAMRLDPRFGSLADGLGLAEYWRRRGIGPDAFLFEA